MIVVPTPGPFGMMGLWLARRFDIPLIVGFHTHYEAIASMYWQRGLARVSQGYLNWCNRLLFRHSSLVLANSPEMVVQATAIGARHTALMGTCIGTSFLVRDRVSITDRQQQRVLFAGRLAAEKNLGRVLECAERLPGVQFTIAGDGPLRDEVTNACARLDNLRYIGWVPRQTLASQLDDHNVLLLLSHVESFGTVALESLARGRPVVVSGRCGITQWPDLQGGVLIADEKSHPAEVLREWFARPYVERERVSRLAFDSARALNTLTLSQWLEWLERPRGLQCRDAA